MWWSSAVSMAGPATLRNEDGAMRNVTERKKSAETFVSALPWIRKNFMAGDQWKNHNIKWHNRSINPAR